MVVVVEVFIFSAVSCASFNINWNHEIHFIAGLSEPEKITQGYEEYCGHGLGSSTDILWTFWSLKLGLTDHKKLTQGYEVYYGHGVGS